MNESSGTSAPDNIAGNNGTLTNFDFDASDGWVTSEIPAGSGTVSTAESFSSGTTTLNVIALTTTDDFDTAVDLQLTTINNSPNSIPDGFTEVVGTKYFVMNIFGSPGSFLTNLTITFGPGVLDSRGDANPGGVKLYKRSDNSDGAWTLFGSAASVNSTTGEVTFNGISSFSQLAVVEDESALPVELTSFTAYLTSNNVELKWQTSTEVNNYGFEIERTLGQTISLSDGQTEEWETIGFVQGHGNSNSPKNYEFTDENPPAGNLKYRLKQIDTEGQFEYYGTIVEINNTVAGVEELNIPEEYSLFQNFPNPFNPVTTIKYGLPENAKVFIEVYNIIGQRIAVLVNEEQISGYHSVEFSGNSLSSGLYIYRMVTNEYSSVKKLMLLK
jgi:hypothetical protein